MKPKLLLYAALLTLTQCSQCKRDDPQPQPPKDPLSLLPPETQTGAGTFGCLVNGKAYVALSSIKCRGDWQGQSTLFVSGEGSLNGDYNNQEIFSAGMLLNGGLRNGQEFNLVRFSQPINSTLSQFAADATIKLCGYHGDYIKAGQVTLVKFDPVARIAAGRFAFVLYEPGGCDTLRVSNGRFDVKF